MDLIEFNCPSCNTALSVPPEAADASGPCPTCGDIIRGPGLPKKSSEPKLEERAAAPPTELLSPLEGAKSTSPENSENTPLTQPSPAQPGTLHSDDSTNIGLGVVAMIALLAVATAFLLGFFAGRQTAKSSATIPANKKEQSQIVQKKTPPKEVATIPEPAEKLMEELPAAENGITPEAGSSDEIISAAKTALVAFLSAPDWTSRLVYVLHPDQVAPKMEAIANSKGDGPIPYQEVMAVGLGRPDAEVFGVTSEQFPEGIPVAMKKVEDQWLIDWAAFAEFYYDGFRTFAESASGYEGIFRVQVAPVEEKPGYYILSAPTAGKSYEAKANSENSVSQQIDPVIDFYKKNSPEQYNAAMQQGGVNFMLNVSRQDVDGLPVIFIEDVVKVGWAPRDPEEN